VLTPRWGYECVRRPAGLREDPLLTNVSPAAYLYAGKKREMKNLLWKKGGRLFIDMHYFCRREPVEVRGRGMGVGPDILRIHKVADVEIG
jgi:hypothetical protein